MYTKSNFDFVGNNTFDRDILNENLRKTAENSFDYLKDLQRSYVEVFNIRKNNVQIQTDEVGVKTLFIEKSMIDISARTAYRLSDFYNRYVTLNELFDNPEIFFYVPMIMIDGLVINAYSIKTTLTDGFVIRFDNPTFNVAEIVNGLEILLIENLSIGRSSTNLLRLTNESFRVPMTPEGIYPDDYPVMAFVEMKDKTGYFAPITGEVVTPVGETTSFIQLNENIASIVPTDRDFNIVYNFSNYLYELNDMREIEYRVINPVGNSLLFQLVNHDDDGNVIPYTMPIPEENIIVFAENKTTGEYRYLSGNTIVNHYPNTYEIMNDKLSSAYRYKIFYMYNDVNQYLRYDNRIKYIYNYLCRKVGRDENDVEGMMKDFIYGRVTDINIDPRIIEYFSIVINYDVPEFNYDLDNYFEKTQDTLIYKSDKMNEFVSYDPTILVEYANGTQNAYDRYSLRTKDMDLSSRIRRNTESETDKSYKYHEFTEDRYVFGFNNPRLDVFMDLRFFIDGLLCPDTFSMIDDGVEYIYIPTTYITDDSYIEVERFDTLQIEEEMVFTSVDDSLDIDLNIPDEDLRPTMFDIVITDENGIRLPSSDFKLYFNIHNEVRKVLNDVFLASKGSDAIYDAESKEWFVNVSKLFTDATVNPDSDTLKYAYFQKLKLYCNNSDHFNKKIKFYVNKVPSLIQNMYTSLTVPRIEIFSSDLVWKRHASYIRTFVNGRLVPTLFTIEEESPFSTVLQFENMFLNGESLSVDISPFSYRLELTINTVPEDFLISFNGKLSLPASLGYYDMYLNGRRLTRNNMQLISADKLKLFNVVSRNKLQIFKRDRDFDFFGLTSKHTSLVDILLESSFITPDEKEQVIEDIIKDNNPDADYDIPGENTEPVTPDKGPVDPESLNVYEFYADVLVPRGYLQPNSFYIDKQMMIDKYPTVYNSYPDQNETLLLTPNVNGTSLNTIRLGK